jgi:DNA-binding NtrC family response regulator
MMADSSSCRVLIVDDEQSVRWSLSVFLDDFGFDVTAVESAEEALTLVDCETFDVAIIDLRLPGMNGDQLILEIHKRSPSTHFMIHTGIKAYTLTDELKKIGMKEKHLFLKPLIDLEVIVNAIRELTTR